MLIGDVAQRAGVRPSALRYYEEIGLLPAPERRSGRRVYGSEILDRLAFIRFAQACGFQLDEVAVLIGKSSKTGPVSERMRSLARDKLAEVDRLIETAQQMKRFLGNALSCQCVDADGCGRLIRQYQRDVPQRVGGRRVKSPPRAIAQ
jgi:MerR family redox-sensitive transcriptional activator SoxR